MTAAFAKRLYEMTTRTSDLIVVLELDALAEARGGEGRCGGGCAVLLARGEAVRHLRPRHHHPRRQAGVRRLHQHLRAHLQATAEQ